MGRQRRSAKRRLWRRWLNGRHRARHVRRHRHIRGRPGHGGSPLCLPACRPLRHRRLTRLVAVVSSPSTAGRVCGPLTAGPSGRGGSFPPTTLRGGRRSRNRRAGHSSPTHPIANPSGDYIWTPPGVLHTLETAPTAAYLNSDHLPYRIGISCSFY